eukprot:4933852-Pleurochrysis_carterae.AAC.1
MGEGGRRRRLDCVLSEEPTALSLAFHNESKAYKHTKRLDDLDEQQIGWVRDKAAGRSGTRLRRHPGHHCGGHSEKRHREHRGEGNNAAHLGGEIAIGAALTHGRRNGELGATASGSRAGERGKRSDGFTIDRGEIMRWQVVRGRASPHPSAG